MLEKAEIMIAQAPKPKPDSTRNFPVMAEKLGLPTVPAAWPSGMASLTQAYEACRRCEAEEVCTDWLARTADSIRMPPAFCPNASEFSRAAKKKAQE